MENEELLNKIMDISIAIARIESQQSSMKEMIASEFILIQKEQTSVMSKVDDMDKDIRQIQKDSKVDLERKYEEAKDEFEKVYGKMESRIKDLESRVDLNEKFKMKIMIGGSLVMGAVVFGNHLVKFLEAVIK